MQSRLQALIPKRPTSGRSSHHLTSPASLKVRLPMPVASHSRPCRSLRPGAALSAVTTGEGDPPALPPVAQSTPLRPVSCLPAAIEAHPLTSGPAGTRHRAARPLPAPQSHLVVGRWTLADPGDNAAMSPPPKPRKGGHHVFWPPEKLPKNFFRKWIWVHPKNSG